MYPIPIIPAQAQDDLGHSALPGAPVVPERLRRTPLRGTRLVLAAALHALARRLEPASSRRTPVRTGPGVRA